MLGIPRAALFAAAALSLICAAAYPQPLSVNTGALSADVQRIAKSVAQGASPATPTLPASLQAKARLDARGRLQVKVNFNCANSAPVTGLTAAGLTITSQVKIPPLCAVEGYTFANALNALALVPGVTKVELPAYAVPRSPHRRLTPATNSSGVVGPLTQGLSGTTINGGGIALMRADQFIASTQVTGAGVTVGVLSDDVTHLSTIVAAGELPGNVTLYPASTNPSPTDEGTMMLEEVHAIAPGASLAFCGPQSESEFVACVQSMIAGGVKIIVDDIAFGDDAMSAQGPFAQAIQSLLNQHPEVLFFSAVGNYEGSYWQGTYAPVALSGSLTCPASGQTDAYVQLFGGATTNILTLHGQLTAPIVLQWADPWNANTSNFDLYVLDQNYNLLTCVPGAGSTDTYDLLSNPNLPAGTYRLAVGTATAQAAGKLLKLLVVGDGISQLSTATSGGIFSPHKYVNGVITVGAVNGADGIGATIEPYSSTGPVTLAFPASSLQAPLLVAPDNIFVDVLGTGFASQAPTGQFRGTSAAAPNAAAVAALLTAAFPGASTTQVLTALKQGATSLGLGQPNNTFGFGRIDAMGALIAMPAPAVGTAGAVIFVAGSSSSTQTTLMLAGTGNLSASVISDNAALLPASAVALDPATCQSANTCLVTLTPQPLQTGVAHLTFTVSDGAHRSATGALSLTVNKPAPPSIVVTGMGTQEVKLGAAVTPATVALTGSGALSLRTVSSNPALLPDGNVTLSAAPCGSSGSACLVNMSPVAGASGTATVTVSATDGYGQSAATTVTLTVDAPPPPSSGGGGSLDLIVIGALAGIAALRRRRVVSKRRTSLPRTSLRTCCD